MKPKAYPRPNAIVKKEIWTMQLQLKTMLEFTFSSKSQKVAAFCLDSLRPTTTFSFSLSEERNQPPRVYFKCFGFFFHKGTTVSLTLKKTSALSITSRRGLILCL